MQVQRFGLHIDVSVGIARPLRLGPVPIEFDAVLIRIAQVQGFAHAVIAGAIERNPGGDQPLQRVGEIGACGVDDRKVIKSGGTRGGRLAALALPGVKSNVVVRNCAQKLP